MSDANTKVVRRGFSPFSSDHLTSTCEQGIGAADSWDVKASVSLAKHSAALDLRYAQHAQPKLSAATHNVIMMIPPRATQPNYQRQIAAVHLIDAARYATVDGTQRSAEEPRRYIGRV